MAKKVIIESGRENREDTQLCKKFFDELTAYNEKHKDNPLNVGLFVVDKDGGNSMLVGDHKKIAKEILQAATYDEHFLDIVNQLFVISLKHRQ